jgi:3-hydroxymyristoyl/3-hydroxydecanoyl-(acyl carrier protein) dehydratase
LLFCLTGFHFMLVTKDNILDLLPQRHPMVMIDGLLSCSESHAVSRMIIKDDNLFVQHERFMAPGLMENMAQTAAARTGYLMKNQQNRTNKKPPVGVIGSIKNFRIYFEPASGSELITAITVEHEVMQALVVKGMAKVNGKLAAEGDLQIFITDNQTG